MTGCMGTRMYVDKTSTKPVHVFICFFFYVAFNTVQVISRRVVGRAEETSTYSSQLATTSFPT